MKKIIRLSFILTLIMCSFLFVGCKISNNINGTSNEKLNDSQSKKSLESLDNENINKPENKSDEIDKETETDGVDEKLESLNKGDNVIENLKENKKTVNEESNAKNGIKIVLDPGHSTNPGNQKETTSPDSGEMKLKDTSGSVGIVSKKNEYDIAMNITLKLKKLLDEEGYNVILTKENVETPLSNIERAEVGNRENADLMIRIHCDSFSNSSAKGASMLVPKQRGYVTKEISDKSIEYGKNIIEKYTKMTGINNRGLQYRNDMTGFNWSKIPVVLLELGFISNPEEDRFLSSEENSYKIAESIKNGINKISFK